MSSVPGRAAYECRSEVRPSFLRALGWFVIGLTCGSIVQTWLYNRSGESILIVAVWHGTYNLVSGAEAAKGTIAAVVSTLVMLQAFLLVVCELRARRRGLPSVFRSTKLKAD